MTRVADVPARYEWSHAFLLLGVRRCEPLWPELGVPVEVIRSPEGALGASREFVLELERLGARGITEAIAPDIRSALGRVAEHFALDYSPRVADEIIDWGARYFARDFPKWARWQWLLLELVYPRSGSTGEETSLSPPTHAWLLAAARARFGREASAKLKQIEVAARAIPLSSVEAALLAIDAGSRGPEDPEMFDVVESAVVTVSLHRTYTLWREMKARLTDEEIRIVVIEARQRAIGMYVDPPSVEDPLSDRG